MCACVWACESVGRLLSPLPEELLSDLRLSPQLAAHMLEWQGALSQPVISCVCHAFSESTLPATWEESIAAAVWASRGKSAPPSLTYRGLLG